MHAPRLIVHSSLVQSRGIIINQNHPKIIIPFTWNKVIKISKIFKKINKKKKDKYLKARCYSNISHIYLL